VARERFTGGFLGRAKFIMGRGKGCTGGKGAPRVFFFFILLLRGRGVEVNVFFLGLHLTCGRRKGKGYIYIYIFLILFFDCGVGRDKTGGQILEFGVPK
jgi:hypothetical protein